MAQAELSIWLRLKDEASKNLEGFKKSVEGMAPAFKTMSAVGVGALAAIGGVGVTALKAFAESEADMVIATQALGNTIEIMSVKQLNQLQSEVGKGVDVFAAMEGKMADVGKAAAKLGVDDEAAAKGFAKLFQATGDAVQAQKDIALAMDLAAFSGKDLDAAVAAVVKTHAGGKKALKEFNIEVDDGATAAEALALVQQRVGGTAAAMADTVAGRMKIMEVAFGNLQEGIGGALAPMFTDLLLKVQPVVDQFVSWADENPQLVTQILAISAGAAGLLVAIGGIGLVLPKIITGIEGLSGAFAFLTSASGIWVLSATALVAGLVLLYTKSEAFRNMVNDLAGAIRDNFIPFMQSSWELAKNLVLAIADVAARFGDWFNRMKETTFVSALVGSLMETFRGLWDVIVTNLWPALQALWNTFTQNLLPALQQLWNALQPLMPIFKAIALVIAGALFLAITAFVVILGKMIEYVAKTLGVLTEFATALTKDIANKIKIGADFIMTMVDAFKLLVSWIEKAWNKLGQFSDKVASSSVGKFLTGARAGGGPVTGGKPYLVGERGPELFMPTSSGKIIPNGGLGGGGGAPIIITGNTFYGEQDLAQQVGDTLVRALKQRMQLS